VSGLLKGGRQALANFHDHTSPGSEETGLAPPHLIQHFPCGLSTYGLLRLLFHVGCPGSHWTILRPGTMGGWFLHWNNIRLFPGEGCRSCGLFPRSAANSLWGGHGWKKKCYHLLNYSGIKKSKRIMRRAQN
jgi:hypothetical protein